jgi:hypothetical protein
VDESSDARSRRLSAQRQRRYRARKKMSPAAGVPGTEVVPAGAVYAGGLPAHAMNPMFGMAAEIALDSMEEARRYTGAVRAMTPEQAMTPMKAGSSPPASEARLQRAEALRALSALAATPVSAVRVMRDVTAGLDLALEMQAMQEGRPSRLPDACMGEDGHIVPGPLRVLTAEERAELEAEHWRDED